MKRKNMDNKILVVVVVVLAGEKEEQQRDNSLLLMIMGTILQSAGHVYSFRLFLGSCILISYTFQKY